MPTPLISKKEAADLLGVHPSTVQRMIDRGELFPKSIWSGDRVVAYLFHRVEVQRLAERRAAA